jgi:ribosomal protein S12 methylthiotransferase
MTRIAVLTLGCEKNTVDSERYLAQMVSHGGEPVDDLSIAEVIVVNTCGFIDAAKKESIDAIVDAGHYKDSGQCRALVAVGCMVERHRNELGDALKEVDLFLGASEMERLVPALVENGLLGDPLADHPGVRMYGGELPHLRYLKASEGCDHGCAFCAIPLMRGKHRSFSVSDIVHEAQLLELQGAREVCLVAQDLAHYGRDLRDGRALPSLLRALVNETSIPWLRLLYLYSAGISPALLETMADEPRILSYLDMPVQHAADDVLKAMRRPERRESIRAKVGLARTVIPEVAIRTTCIVGFPGETDAQFETLLEFLEEMAFDGVGCFTYSAQEGTRAHQLHDDVPESLKRERQERVTGLQRSITAARNSDRVGQSTAAIVDVSVNSGSQARAWWQAHDVDGIVLLDQAHPAGTILQTRICGVQDDYDLRGNVERVVAAAPVPAEVRRSRALPLVLASTGAYGR